MLKFFRRKRLLLNLLKKNFLSEQEMWRIYGIKYKTLGKEGPERFHIILDREGDLERLTDLYRDIIDIFDGENKNLYFSSGNNRVEEAETMRNLKLQDIDKVYKLRYFQSLSAELVRLNDLHANDPQKAPVNSNSIIQFIKPAHNLTRRTWFKRIWPIVFTERRGDRWFSFALAIFSALMAILLQEILSNPTHVIVNLPPNL